MALRSAIYVLILAVGLLGALGLERRAPQGQAGGAQSVLAAGPLAASNGGGNNGSGNNGSSSGSNGSGNNSGNNSVQSATATPTPTQTATPKPAATATPTRAPAPVPGPCTFQLGFKTLHDMIPTTVGDCRTDEMHNPENGDGLQLTVGGLLVWRKLDNWTAFTNGSLTWINGPCGLQTRSNSETFPWEGRPGAACT